MLAWVFASVSAAAITEIFAYIHASDSNHTAFEPWLLVALFVPTIVMGLVVIKRHIMVAVLLITIGSSGLAVLTYIDRTNTMVQYDRWLSRGMPGPHEPSRHQNVR